MLQKSNLCICLSLFNYLLMLQLILLPTDVGESCYMQMIPSYISVEFNNLLLYIMFYFPFLLISFLIFVIKRCFSPDRIYKSFETAHFVYEHGSKNNNTL